MKDWAMTTFECAWQDRVRSPPLGSYFDCAHMGLLPVASEAAFLAGMRDRASPWRESGLQDRVEELRRLFGGMIGARADSVAIVPSASYGMAVAARLFPVSRGQSVIVLEDEHPSQVMAWEAVCRMQQARLIRVPRPAEGLWSDAVAAAITQDCAVLCLPQCHWLDGEPLELETIAANARAVGAALIVDGTQSVGARTFDTSAIEPDVLVASGYKWLLGPVGLGYLHVHSKHWNRSPVEHGWSNLTTPDGRMFGTDGRLQYPRAGRDGARRFDAAGTSRVLIEPAIEGLRLIGETGLKTIERTLVSRAACLGARYPELPLLGRPGSARHFLTFGLASATEGCSLLAKSSVYASVRGNRLRVSGHLWNDADDFERLDGLLARLAGVR